MVKPPTRPYGGPWLKKDLHQLGKHLVYVAKQKDTVHLSDWRKTVPITDSNYKNLLYRHPDILRPYHDQACEILGNKILRGAFKGKQAWLYKSLIMSYLPDFRREYMAQKEEELALLERIKKLQESEKDAHGHELLQVLKSFIETKYGPAGGEDTRLEDPKELEILPPDEDETTT